MSDELALRKDLERASQAEELLKQPLLAEAFTILDESYVKAWRNTPVRDVEAREKIWQAMQIVGRVKAHLEEIVVNGAIAKHALKDLTEKPKRFGIV